MYDSEDAAVLADALILCHDVVERRLNRIGEAPRRVGGAKSTRMQTFVMERRRTLQPWNNQVGDTI